MPSSRKCVLFEVFFTLNVRLILFDVGRVRGPSTTTHSGTVEYSFLTLLKITDDANNIDNLSIDYL